MKKILIASGVAVLAFAMIASAQGYTFSSNLTVGSTGPAVVALQSFLQAKGFSIPSLTSGAAQPGYFGSQTKAAVVKYQASVGVPNTGFVGPLTRAQLNGGSTVASTGCPAGYTCTSNQVVNVTCPAGYTCTSNTGTGTVVGSTAGITTIGIPGTLVTSLWNSPSDGTVVYKGQSYDVVAYKLQAAASDMAVQSISLDFNTRLWLYAGTITLKDDTGAIVGQVNNLQLNNFSELTSGSDYRITIPVSNYVIKATQTRYLTANLTFLATSDRLTNANMQVTQAQIRAVDGTGVTDTETTPVASVRTFSYQGSGAGTIAVTVDSASPLQGLVGISTGGQTPGVPLAVYDIKSQNAPSNFRAISFVVYTTGGKTPEQLFSKYTLSVNGQSIGANLITPNGTANGQSSTTVSFNNFGSITLAADTYIPLRLLADVQQDTSNALDGVMASTSLVVAGSNPDVEDGSYTVLSVNTGVFVSSNLTFSASSATLVNSSTPAPTAVTNAKTGSTTYNVSFNVTITAGNNTLYVGATPALFASSTATGGLTLTLNQIVANPNQLAGDDTNNFVVPAGASRQFTLSGSVTGASGASGIAKITNVAYGTAATTFNKSINYNLGSLQTTNIAIP